MSREKDEVYSNGTIMDVLEKASIGDGRKKRGVRHSMKEILFTILVGFLLGCVSLREIVRKLAPDDDEKLRKKNERALAAVIDLPFGIAESSTLARAVAKLDPVPFVTAFSDYMLSLVPGGSANRVAIDGKAIRAAMKKEKEGRNYYIVNVFEAAYHLFMYQLEVGNKSCEARKIEEEIADILDGDCPLVTLDAMGTKKAILDIIYGKGGDAVQPAKANNRNLMDEILDIFRREAEEDANADADANADTNTNTNTNADADADTNTNANANADADAGNEEDNSHVDHFLDLDGYKESDSPRDCIENVQCKVFEEDNHTGMEESEDPGKPASSLALFENEYKYYGSLDGIDFDRRRSNHLYLVLINGKYVPMVMAHGRLERREYDLITDPVELAKITKGNRAFEEWEFIAGIGIATRYRGEYVHDSKTKEQILKVSVTRTPYILTKKMTVEGFAEEVRRHWACEVGHNFLDEVFREDRCTSRTGNAAQNLSLLRKLAFNITAVYRRQQGNDGDDMNGFKAAMESLGSDIGKIARLLNKRIRSPFK